MAIASGWAEGTFVALREGHLVDAPDEAGVVDDRRKVAQIVGTYVPRDTGVIRGTRAPAVGLERPRRRRLHASEETSLAPQWEFGLVSCRTTS